MSRASLVDQTGKNLPAIQETRVRFLSWFYPLENKWTVFLSGEFHGQRNLVGYGPWGHREWRGIVYGVTKNWTGWNN